MRIGMVVPYDLAEEGGVKRHAMQLASVLRSLGDEVDVIGPSRRSLGLEHVFTFGGVVNVPSNGSDNHIGLFTRPDRVRSFIRERGYDVLHLHEPLVPALPYYALWSAGEAARVATFHAFTEHQSALGHAVRVATSAITLGMVDRGIAVSPAAAQLARTTFTKPLAIIPNGIDTTAYRRTAPREPLGEPVRLLFVGHWRDPRKGLQYLLDACVALPMPWSLDVVGDGGSVAKREHPNVRYHGAVGSEERIAELYAACDLFVAPSTGMESFGIVLLEAMAAGRAIVCSDIEGYRAVVGDAAVLVAPQHSAALARAIGELAADPGRRAQLAAAGRARVKQFDWNVLVGDVRAEYLAAIAARRGDVASRKHVSTRHRSRQTR
jgi:phosphatidyl-myo-inositol alpha-mannosyltransferase